MSVRVAAVVTQFIGIIWAVIALVYRNDTDNTLSDMTAGIAVTAAGFTVWIAAGCWERNR